ncbi:competence/damage-inducible protein A [Azotosporobacter soli]|uniref:competence/damage-inducible protein A n=1 Tax=Azotosporobacter soli TaxID=3055040 RepID=UPI0031FF1C10
MIVEIVSTGTELLLGHIVNTNVAFLSRQLNNCGFDVLYQSTVGDNRERMRNILKIALKRADIIITSGGLGPTQGDITKEVIAELCQRPLELHQASLKRIEDYFVKRGTPMAESNRRQAMLPKGSVALPNDVGTAPGVVLEQDGKWIVSLPGPPHELEHMFHHQLAPFLSRNFDNQGHIISHIFHTYGIGESLLEEKMMDLILEQDNPTLALLAQSGEIIIRLTAKAATEEEAKSKLCAAEKQLRERIDPYIWGCDEESVEEVVAALLKKTGSTIAFAESCTGGLTSHLLTNIAGSSAYLKGSLVCYSEESKVQHLAVESNVIKTKGIVSQEVARQMAIGVTKMFNTEFGVGITGWAGPANESETADKIGTVSIAVTNSQAQMLSETFSFRGDRMEVKTRAAKAALHLIRQFIKQKKYN